jgi:phosphoribosylformylglycinamidine (FGAM) synthase-like enzyme
MIVVENAHDATVVAIAMETKRAIATATATEERAIAKVASTGTTVGMAIARTIRTLNSKTVHRKIRTSDHPLKAAASLNSARKDSDSSAKLIGISIRPIETPSFRLTSSETLVSAMA